jgi:hypothetical protein
MSIDWNGQLVDQLNLRWQHRARGPISLEAIHHGADICLLHDLYRNRG